MLYSLQVRFDEALKQKWSFSDFLERLLQDEVERRDSKQLARRLLKSGLASGKTLETFDFGFNPKIHEPAIRGIAGCYFMKDKEDVLFVGPCGKFCHSPIALDRRFLTGYWLRVEKGVSKCDG